jgi:isoleucyl-tRNA synthetase
MSKKIDYKKTLNLPGTDMPMKANLPEREPKFLEFWQEKNIYQRLNEASEKKPKYILHDGPPYANGHIHMGHVLNKILKDIIVKYKSLRGSYCPFVPGWDCHGLPVEHQLFKELNLSKDDISQVEFRKKAKDYALKYVEIQKREFKRLGIFGDWENPYLTLSNDYEAQILKSFAKIVEQGFIYRGRKPVNWCPHCQTALAEAEVEYKNRKSSSIYVKFKLKEEDKNRLLQNSNLRSLRKRGEKDFNLIIWTTTPWTLISNIALALNPNLKYVFIDVGDEVWILAEKLLDKFAEKISKKNYTKPAAAETNLLKSLKCSHPFTDRASIIIEADFVSSDEGTGCVHIAPGHGQEDYLSWLKYKDKYDDFEIIMPVNDRGVFEKEAGEFSGKGIEEANDLIIRKLEEKRSLVYQEDIVHSYPHCWRCKRPIIFRATGQWFMKIDHNGLRDKLKEEITDKVQWNPRATKARILSMIESRPDWCLSRQRYWGVPIPVVYCKRCKHALLDSKFIFSLAEKVEREGLDIWFKKEAGELLPQETRCPECSHNEFTKEEDILDVWFDSGVSHQAVLRKREELIFPAHLYLEGSDQHRGWFQTSLITSLAIEKKAPYRKVLTHGFIVDAEGRKMSKSQGNVVSPDEVIKDLGADILRLWVASSEYRRDVSLSKSVLERLTDAYRKIRNTLRFMLGNLYDFDKDKDKLEYKDLLDLDKWALNKVAELYHQCLNHYETFEFHKVFQGIYNFCTQVLSSFYLDVLKDRLYTWGKDSRGRRSGQTALYSLLISLVKLISPILTFTAEEVYSYLPTKKEESVFLDGLGDDEQIAGWKNDDLDKIWDRLLKTREVVLKALEIKRSQGLIGNSLQAEIELFTNDNQKYKFLKSYEKQLPDVFIVSKAVVNKVDKPPKDAIIAENTDQIAVRVKRSKNPKCPRCWRCVEVAGGKSENKEICQRCAAAIK